MVKALLFKEWLKVQWAVTIMLAVFILIDVKIALNVAYGIRFYEANVYWNEVIIRGYLFYADIMYVPLLAGIVIAFTQFFPEINESRLKLTLHLPVAENSIFLYMVLFGTIILSAIFIVAIIILSFISLYFFPVQVLNSMFLTSSIWFLAGLAGYWAAAAIFIEPIWLKRIILIIISFGFVDSYLQGSNFNQYQYSWYWFLLLSLCMSTALIYTGHRFRKGVM